uniref:Umc2756 n=1 Tax=Arundo donax TaxID=35708 RepID=A0A0A9HI90_ARUDO
MEILLGSIHTIYWGSHTNLGDSKGSFPCGL